MNRYFDDIRANEQTLTKEQEWLLIAKAQSGCSISRDIVFNSNARFVIQKAKERRMTEYLPDLVQAGNIGILKAIERFDVKSGNKFISFATWYVRSEINLWLSANYRTIRIPSNVLQEIESGKIEKEEITSSVSLTGLDDDNTGFVSHSTVQPELLLINKKEQLSKILSYLSKNQQEILKMRIGYYDGEIYSFKQIAKKVHKKAENCSTQYQLAIKKLRAKYTQQELFEILS